MIEITDPRIERYLVNLAPEDDEHVVAMEKKAAATGFPIVGRLVGRLLYLLTRLKQPKLIIEMGSGFGYSSYWFAKALSLRAKVVLIDENEENLSSARRMFTESALADRAEFRVGEALKIGREYTGIDLLFIDINKHEYFDTIKAMTPLLAKNALVIADNTLWRGTVAEGAPQDKDAEGIAAFNRYMFNNKDFFTSIIPLRDGVLVAYKLTDN